MQQLLFESVVCFPFRDVMGDVSLPEGEHFPFQMEPPGGHLDLKQKFKMFPFSAVLKIECLLTFTILHRLE